MPDDEGRARTLDRRCCNPPTLWTRLRQHHLSNHRNNLCASNARSNLSPSIEPGFMYRHPLVCVEYGGIGLGGAIQSFRLRLHSGLRQRGAHLSRFAAKMGHPSGGRSVRCGSPIHPCGRSVRCGSPIHPRGRSVRCGSPSTPRGRSVRCGLPSTPVWWEWSDGCCDFYWGRFVQQIVAVAGPGPVFGLRD
jgi:hypothetical protein